VAREITRVLVQNEALLSEFWCDGVAELFSKSDDAEISSISSQEEFLQFCKSLSDKSITDSVEKWDFLTNCFRKFHYHDVMVAMDLYEVCIDDYRLTAKPPFVKIVEQKIASYKTLAKYPGSRDHYFSPSLAYAASENSGVTLSKIDRMIFGCYLSLPIDILTVYFMNELKYTNVDVASHCER